MNKNLKIDFINSPGCRNTDRFSWRTSRNKQHVGAWNEDGRGEG